MSYSYNAAWLKTLESEYEVNASKRWPHAAGQDADWLNTSKFPPQAKILNDNGMDWLPISGHGKVSGHELTRRIDLAIKQRDVLNKAIEHTSALLAARMQELMEGEHVPADESSREG